MYIYLSHVPVTVPIVCAKGGGIITDVVVGCFMG